jgi:hypothetical protein
MNRTALLLFFALASPVFGHHSIALFDSTRTITIKGIVKEFQWLNPHALLWVNVESENGGTPQLWAVEMTSPGVLTRNGWTKRSFNAGDKVNVEIGPLRDGKPGGLFRKAVLLDSGKVLTYTMQPALKPDSQ